MEYTNEFASRLKFAMRLRNKKAVDVCNATGLSSALISQYLTGKFEPKNDKAFIIANYLKINPAWLLGWIDDINTELDGKGRIIKNGRPTGKRVSDVTGEVVDDDSIFEITANPNIFKVPLYDSISCGTGGFVDDNIIDYVSLPAEMFSSKKEYFAQYAKGDSMINANINNGDLVIFEKTSSVSNGMIGCFCVDDNIATCKRLSITNGQIILLPENPSYNPIIANVETFKCIGKLAFVINDRRAEEDK